VCANDGVSGGVFKILFERRSTLRPHVNPQTGIIFIIQFNIFALIKQFFGRRFGGRSRRQVHRKACVQTAAFSFLNFIIDLTSEKRF
jgi:hypothetical protein